MADTEVAAFVRSNLPSPPCRVLEVGAGAGELAAALAAAGYAVMAIDPEPRGADVRAAALADLDPGDEPFAAAVAIRSLHHVHPLGASLQRLASVLTPGAPLVIDEMDVAAFDRRAAEWWLARQAERGTPSARTADELVDEHRAHLHPLEAILDQLRDAFTFGTPLRGPWLHRWDLGPELRAEEERLIASGELPAMGARLVALRRG
jgi:SAM-dependent methyltransferase